MGIVDTDQIQAIANLLAKIDREIPFTILAFFPEYRMMKNRAPNLQEMIAAFTEVKATGLKNVRLGDSGIFAQKEEDYQLLLEEVGLGSFGKDRDGIPICLRLKNYNPRGCGSITR
jgi:hypothetical protein